MKGNIKAITDHTQYGFSNIEDERCAFFQIGSLGVAFIDLDTKRVITDDERMDECLEQYSHEHWDEIKKDFIHKSLDTIYKIREIKTRARYMQVCADYIDSLEEAEDRMNRFIQDLESTENQYLG